MNKCNISCVNNQIFVKIYSDITIKDVHTIEHKIKCISNLYKILEINLELEENIDAAAIDYLKKYLISSNQYYKIKTYNYILE